MTKPIINIAIIDYGMGNLHSVEKALQHAATLANQATVRIHVSADPEVIKTADKVLLPGVGAMRDCMGEMQRLDLIGVIKDAAQHKPFLGVCIGMQALMDSSDENNGVDCLALFNGKVRHFDLEAMNANPESEQKLKIPHMGWNQLTQINVNGKSHPLWQDIPQQQRFYFVHSYVVEPEDEAIIAGTSAYGQTFSAAIARDNVFATQFHPEKSADAGLQLFSNFIHWNGEV